jgi:hypothetical protein
MARDGPLATACKHYYNGSTFTTKDLHAGAMYCLTAFGSPAMDWRLISCISNAHVHQFSEETRLALERAMNVAFGDLFRLDVRGQCPDIPVEDCWLLTMVNTMPVVNELTGAQLTLLRLTTGSWPVLSRFQEVVYRCWPFVLKYAEQDLASFRPSDYPYNQERPRYLDIMPHQNLLSSNLPVAKNCSNYLWTMRQYLNKVDRAHTDVFRGGVTSRIAQEFGGQGFFMRLQQGLSWTALGYQEAMTYSNRGYCVEQVTDAEVNILAGWVTNKQYGNNTYLFQTDEIWTTAGRMSLGSWLESDKRWYQSRLKLLYNGVLKPLSRAKWLRKL